MLLARLHEWDKVPLLEEAVAPGPPGTDELVVRLEAAAVTHLDLTVMSGRFAYRPPLPFTPGTSAVGTVTAPEGPLTGSRVTIRGAGVGLVRDGTWAEFARVPAAAVRPLGQQLGPAVAATCYAPVTTAWAAVTAVGRVEQGQRVLVTGASGAVGSMCVQLAVRAGARVVAIVGGPAKAALVPAGADRIVAGRAASSAAEAATEAATDGLADVLLDTVGGDSLASLLAALRPGGTAVLIGYTAGEDIALNLPGLLARDIRLLPVNMIRQQVPGQVAAELLDSIAAGDLTLRVREYPLAGLADAIGALRSGTGAGTVAVVP